MSYKLSTPLNVTLFLALSIALPGCGGTEGVFGVNNSIELSASSRTITYGDQVTISWISRNTDTAFQNGFRDSNFADFRLPLPPSGSITDRPAITTTYRMTVQKDNGDLVTDSINISVPRGNKRFLVVAGTTSADGSSAAALLPQITTVTPTVSETIPATGDGYDVLVLSEGGNYGTADQPKILTWLNAGKGVIVIGAAAQQLASGAVSTSFTSTASISGWFGGVSSMEKDLSGASLEFEINETQIGYSPTYRNWNDSNAIGRSGSLSTYGRITAIGGGAVVQSTDPFATPDSITSFSFVFGSGRVYFIAGLQGPAVTPSDSQAEIREFFLPGARWVSGE